MTRKIHAASLLAGALLMIPVLGATQAATPRPASQPAAAPAAAATPTMPSDADVQLLREDIRSKRKQIVAANMTLTADEATKFWPLYDEYTVEVRKINDRRWAMIKDYSASKGTFTDTQAKDYMEQSIEIDGELIALRGKFMPRFDAVVSPKKVVQFYQIDRRLDLIMNLQLASLVPIIDPMK